jgi:Pectate lyase superfamily protein
MKRRISKWRFLIVWIMLAGTTVTISVGDDFNVRDYGAVGDGVTDDTVALQKAFNAANKVKDWQTYREVNQISPILISPTIKIPAGNYKISKSLKIGLVNINGGESAVINQINKNEDIFVNTVNAWHMTIRGVTFIGGRDAIALWNDNRDKGFINIESCRFLKQSGFAIRILPHKSGFFSTYLLVSKCTFIRPMQVLVSYCDATKVENSWISTHKSMYNKAAIENRGKGSHGMILENIVGVPSVTPGKKQRWVDNYDRIIIRDSRFGGEKGGFTAVYNHVKANIKYPITPTGVWIYSSMLWARHDRDKNAAIFCKEIPNQIIFRDNSGLANSSILAFDKSLNLEEFFGRIKRHNAFRFEISGNVELIGTKGDLPEPMKRYQSFPSKTSKATLSTQIKKEATKRKKIDLQAIKKMIKLYKNKSPKSSKGSFVKDIWGGRSRSGEYVWRIDFSTDFDSNLTLFMIYLDADNNPTTGRQGHTKVKGTDMMMRYKSHKADLIFANKKLLHLVKGKLRCIQKEKSLFFILPVDLPLVEGYTQYRFRFVSEGINGNKHKESLGAFISVKEKFPVN